MKNTITAILIFIITLIEVEAEFSPILSISNSDFEQTDKQLSSAWRWWSRSNDGHAEYSTNKYTGKFSACIKHNGTQDWAFLSRTKFEVKPGDTFKVSAFVKTAEGIITLSAVALENDDLLSWNIGSSSTSSNQWIKLETDVEVPDYCNNIYVRFTGNAETLAWIDDVQIQPYKTPIKTNHNPKVNGYATQRIREKLDRGVFAQRKKNGNIYIGWRMLPQDSPNITFNVYRKIKNQPPYKINKKPITSTTDFIDSTPPSDEHLAYLIQPVENGISGELSQAALIQTNQTVAFEIKLQGNYKFQKVAIADIDGDSRYDFVIKQPDVNVDPYINYWKKSPGTYKLEAYDADGKFLWKYDLGWSIEQGIWYSPYVVYDFNGDGKAEVALKTGKGDLRDDNGRVQSGPEYLTILDGKTGTQIAQTSWPDRSLFNNTSRPYNLSSRNQIGVAYLDGKTPCLIVERGTYNTIIVEAYELKDAKLNKLWQWDNRKLSWRYQGQGAHWMHCVDLDDDGRDEIVIGSAVIDDNGDILWSTGLGHPDHVYVGDLMPSNPGLEIYYGLETRQAKKNGICMVDAASGKIIWGHDKPTRHVHGRGMCSDILPEYPGAECYSVDTDKYKKPSLAYLRTSSGKIISNKILWSFGPHTVYWDENPQREIIWKHTIRNHEGKIYQNIKGKIVAIADIIGDWREEIITSDNGILRCYTTTIPATDRQTCLMTDHLYRIDVAHASMGYTQVPMLSYNIANKTNTINSSPKHQSDN